MQQFCTYGSVRGASGQLTSLPRQKSKKTSYFENVLNILYSCAALTNSRRTCSAIFPRNPV